MPERHGDRRRTGGARHAADQRDRREQPGKRPATGYKRPGAHDSPFSFIPGEAPSRAGLTIQLEGEMRCGHRGEPPAEARVASVLLNPPAPSRCELRRDRSADGGVHKRAFIKEPAEAGSQRPGNRPWAALRYERRRRSSIAPPAMPMTANVPGSGTWSTMLSTTEITA